MSDIVPYRRIAERRLSRAALRAWLAEGEPKTVTQIHNWAKRQLTGVKRDAVVEILENHPRLFTKLDDDRWTSSVGDTSIRVVSRKSSQKVSVPKKSMRQRKTSSRRAPPRAPAPPSPSPDLIRQGDFHVTNGVVREILFKRSVEGAEPYESGGMILLYLPQERELPAAMLEHAVGWMSGAVDCRVFEALPDAAPLFRGSRRVVHVSIDATSCRLRVILDRADNDSAPRRAFALRSCGARSPQQTALSPWAGVPAASEAEVFQALPSSTVAAATGPLRLHRFDPARATAEAQPRLKKLNVDSTGWEAYSHWLIEQRTKWGREAMEEVVGQTLGLKNVEPAKLVETAKFALGEEPILRPATARAVLRKASQCQSVWLCQWALSVWSSALPSAVDTNSELLKIRAKVLTIACAHSEAAQAFDELRSMGQTLDVADMELYLMSASLSEDSDNMRNALNTWDTVVGSATQSDHLLTYSSCFEYALEIAVHLRNNVPQKLAQLLQAESERSEEAAISAARFHLTRLEESLKKNDVFFCLSVLETMESARCLDSLATILEEYLSRWSEQTSTKYVSDWIDQLRFVETLVGAETPRANHHAARLAARQGVNSQPTVATKASNLLKGSFALVGGRKATRERTESELRRLGATGVDHVPASFDDGISQAKVAAVFDRVDTVVLITDYVKHDVQALLRSQHANIRFVSGGPSRIVRELLRQQ